MIRYGGQYRSDVLDLHIRAQLQDHGNAPPVRIPQPLLEEQRNVRRHWRMRHVIDRSPREASRVSSGQTLGERGHRLVLV
jgi:hypothetical protein